jgi:hypothetical protein
VGLVVVGAVIALYFLTQKKAAPVVYGSGGAGDVGPPSSLAPYGSGDAGDVGPPGAYAPYSPPTTAPLTADSSSGTMDGGGIDMGVSHALTDESHFLEPDDYGPRVPGDTSSGWSEP